MVAPMSELGPVLEQWHAAGEPYALASIVAAHGSTPRAVGPALAVRRDGRVLGSVSGGCVDAAVYDLCMRALNDEPGPHRETYAETQDPFAPGLVCAAESSWSRPGASTPGESSGSAKRGGRTSRVCSSSAPSRSRAMPWSRWASCSDIGVTVCDARPIFATPERYPAADEVVVEWPHRYLAETGIDARTAVCVLTHDEKFDVPVLQQALRMPVGFVGAIGSRKTCAERVDRLRALGLEEYELNRLRSPIGLDLGAHTPEEVAVSILAEIIAVARGGSCLPLRTTEGPIHHRTGSTNSCL